MAETERVPLGLRLMAASAFSFSVMAALLKLAGSALPLFEIVVLRSSVVALLAGAGVVWQGLSFVPHERRLVAWRALFGFLALSCYFYSLIHLPLADATVIYFTNPVLTALGASVLLREHMGRREVGLVLVSLVGVLVVARPSFLFGADDALDPLAVGVGLVSAIFATASYLTIRKIRSEPPVVVVFWFATASVLMGLPIVALDYVRPTVADLIVVAGIGLATHLGQLAITWAFRLERAGRASAVGYLQIVFAAMWGWLLFREVPDAWTWVGAGLIIGATLRLTRVQPAR